MFSNDLRLDLIGIDFKMLCQVNAELQAVQKGTCAQDAIMSRADAGNIGEGIRRIGHHQNNRARCSADDTRNDVAVDFGIGFQKPQPTLGIVTIRGAAGLFVDAGSDHHQGRIRQILKVPVDDCRLWAKRRSVAKVGRDCLGAFAGSVHNDDVAGTAANHGRERACTSDPSCAYDSNLHDHVPFRKMRPIRG